MIKQWLISMMAVTTLAGCQACGDKDSDNGIAEDPRQQAVLEQMQWLQQAEPLAMAREAIASGDLKLLASGGRGLKVPGLTAEERAAAEANCRIQVMAGAGDVIYGEAHMQLRKKAVAFAEEYNRLMLESCVSAAE